VKTRTQEDQSVMGYLLGTASELEQSQIETRYFREPHFYEELLALEEELICDYLNHALTTIERRQFEQHFLATPRRQRKYESTRKLLAFIADQGPTQIATPIEPARLGLLALSVRWINDFFVPRLGFLWTLTSVAVLTLGVWMLSVQVSAYRQQVEQQEARQASTQKNSTKARSKTIKQRVESNTQRNPLAGVADQLQASLDAPPEILTGGITRMTASTIAATLRPSTLRASEAVQLVTLPAEATTLQLNFLLGDSARAQFVSFNIVLKTVNRSEVLRRQNLSSQISKSDKSLSVAVPVSKLETGKYVASIYGVTPNKEIKPTDEYFLYIKRD
jgi:hypothetical protein